MDGRTEVEHKLERVREWLERHGLQGVHLRSQDWFAWITAGGRSHISIGEVGGVASVVVTGETAFLLTTNIESRRLLDEEIPHGAPFVPVERAWYEVVTEGDRVRDLVDPARVATDLPGGGSEGLRLAPADLVELRYTLLPAEIERYRSLGTDAAAAVEIACASARPGDREADVAARVASEARARDILPLVDLVAADGRIASYRHPLPTDRRIDHTLLVALTGRRHGLHASLTRMVSFGEPDRELRDRHDAVLRVDACELLESTPGATLGAVFEAGAARYAEEGWPEQWRAHHQGGLTGYAGREIFATPSSAHVLRSGQALAWNPSITRVKSEDTILVTERGPEVLTATGAWKQRTVELSHGKLDRPDLLVV